MQGVEKLKAWREEMRAELQEQVRASEVRVARVAEELRRAGAEAQRVTEETQEQARQAARQHVEGQQRMEGQQSAALAGMEAQVQSARSLLTQSMERSARFKGDLLQARREASAAAEAATQPLQELPRGLEGLPAAAGGAPQLWGLVASNIFEMSSAGGDSDGDAGIGGGGHDLQPVAAAAQQLVQLLHGASSYSAAMLTNEGTKFSAARHRVLC